MKILYHHRTASRDGQAVHIDEMIASLRALGHEVRVVCPAPAPAEEGGRAAMGGEVGWVQRLRERLPKAAYELLELGYSLLSFWRLWRAAREFQPDMLYERYNLYLMSGLLLKRLTGLPMLLEVNAPLADERAAFGGLGLPRLARWAEDAVWRGADAVLPVTRVLGQRIAACGVAPERIVIVPNGINEHHFAEAPAPAQARAALGWDGALVLGFTGFVRDWHGVDRVLRWLASPQAPVSARLLVVGDGPARADLEALARELVIVERVRFTGVVPRDQVPALVAAFDIALQPAVVPYASPLKLFEYLALGKAIIAPALPNIQEVLSHRHNAWLFDDSRPGDFEAGLTALCADSVLRERLAAEAEATIAAQGLTWQRNAQRAVAIGQALRSGQPVAEAAGAVLAQRPGQP